MPTNTLRPRMVRLPADGVRAELGGGMGNVINISAGGALIKVDREPPLGGSERLILVKGDNRALLKAVVLRVSPGPKDGDIPQWFVAVQFETDAAEMRRIVSKLLEPAPPSPGKRPGVPLPPSPRRS